MNTIQSVRDSIKHNTIQSLAIVARIRSTKGRERYNAWDEKRRLGANTRYLLLALAFLRKRPYRRAEQRTNTPVDARVLAEKLGDSTLKPELESWLAGGEARPF